MAERISRKLDEINWSRHEELKRLLNNQEIYWFLIDQIIEIIGPLDIGERWHWLEKVGLKSIRQHINKLDGSAFIVATDIVTHATKLGHPLNTAILMTIAGSFGLGHYENILQPFLTEFTEEKQ